MAQINIAEIYSGEKYEVMSAAMVEYLRNGRLQCTTGGLGWGC